MREPSLTKSFATRLPRWPELLLLLIIAVLAGRQLLFTPIVGVADNADYFRVMEPLGLAHAIQAPACYQGHFQQFYKIGEPAPIQMASSQLLTAWLALRLDVLLTGDDTFDIRWLGGVNLLLFLTGLYFLLRGVSLCAPAFRFVFWPLLLLAATEADYIAYFNSFYTESISLIALTCLLGVAFFFLKTGRAASLSTVAYFLAAGLLVTSKLQHGPLAVVLILPPLLWTRRREIPRPTLKLVLPLVLLLLGLAAWHNTELPRFIRQYNLYNTLFHTLLAESDDAPGDLAELGLDPGLARLAGTTAYDGNVPVFDVTEHFGHQDIALFYLKHPARLYGVADHCSAHLFSGLLRDVGSYTAGSGLPPGSLPASFRVWRRLQRFLLASRLWCVLLIMGSAAIGAACVWDGRGMRGEAGQTAALLFTVSLASLLSLLVAIVGEGLYDLPKHLYLCQALLDICVIACLAGGAALLWERIRRKKESHKPRLPERRFHF